MTGLLQDLRYALRQLRKNPGFTAVAVVTLALGIGANTAIFSLINAIMLRTLPVHDPQSLVIVTWVGRRHAHAELGEYMWGGCPSQPATACSFSYPMFRQIHAEQSVFSGMFGFLPANLAINVNGQSSEGHGLYVTGDFFTTLGVRPTVGRLLTPLDDSTAAAPAVVVSHRFWQNMLSADREAVGKTLFIGKSQFTLVGVAQPETPDLDPGVPKDFWLPLSFQPLVASRPMNMNAANAIWLQLMARLKPGVSAVQAASAISAIFSPRASSGPEAIFAPSDSPHIELPTAAHGMASLRHAFSQPLYALFAAVVLTLLIACANIAGLMLARSAARRKEIAMRTALGATRGRVLRQLLTESLLLSAAGGIAGIVLGYWGAEALSAFLSRNWWIALQVDVHPDLRVLAFTVGVCVFTGLVFGLAPAFSNGEEDLLPALKEGSRSKAGPTSGRHMTLGNGLVVLQTALAVLVLAGAGLLARTLNNLKAVNTGFDPQNLVVFGMDSTYSSRAAGNLKVLNQELRDQLAALPGVTSATYSEVPLLSGGGMQNVIAPGTGNRTGSWLTVDFLAVAPGFFQTMRIPLLAGRSLNAQDAEDEESVGKHSYQHVVINENLAHLLFGQENPLGQRFRPGTTDSPLNEVVGVVRDSKYDSLRYAVMPTIYAVMGNERASFEVRTAMDPKALMPEIRAAVSRFDSNVLITNMKTQMEQIDQNIYQERLIANLSSLFALLALVVACMGIYGLLAYQVTRRTQEIGIRLALGAQRGDVLRMVIRQGVLLSALGALIGVAAAWAVTRYLESFLFGVKPSDPMTIGAAAVGLIVVALFASYLPARRAMNTDPMVALRYE